MEVAFRDPVRGDRWQAQQEYREQAISFLEATLTDYLHTATRVASGVARRHDLTDGAAASRSSVISVTAESV